VPQLTALSLLRFAPFPFKHLAGVVFAPLLDRFLYRHPFEGGSARRYATEERPAFGDLDDRLLDGIDLASARRLLDLGCGPATFSERAAARHPGLTVIAVDPSRAFVRDLIARRPKLSVVQAAGEALPFADRSIDAAMMLSSIRHVKDRAATFRELRRVVHGTVTIVELDPDADARRVATHANRLGSRLLRHAFGPFVLRTAPHADAIASIARRAGFVQRSLRSDPIQPVYIMELA
jgi:SAM-dependent methyltransferase